MNDHLGHDPKTMEAIKAAFRAGEREWENHIKTLFGEKEADRLKSILPQEDLIHPKGVSTWRIGKSVDYVTS